LALGTPAQLAERILSSFRQPSNSTNYSNQQFSSPFQDEFFRGK
jgi:hypothetical protein